MPESSSPRFPPALVIPLGILAVSTASILIRYAQTEASSLAIAAFRLGLSVIFLSPYVIWKHREELRRLTGPDLRLALFSGLLLAVHFASWISSLEYTTVASSVVLVTTTPLWVAVMGPLFLGEKVSRQALGGMGLALLGGVVVALSDGCQGSLLQLNCPTLQGAAGSQALLGDGLALLGALTAAGYMMVGRHLRQKLSLASYIFLVYLMAAGCLFLVLFLREGIPTGYGPEIYLWLILLALVPQLMGHTILNWALRYLPAALVSLSLLGEPVGSTVLAALLLGERPSALKLFGAILILLGIAAASGKTEVGKK